MIRPACRGVATCAAGCALVALASGTAGAQAPLARLARAGITTTGTAARRGPAFDAGPADPKRPEV
ncbi:MAG TPA: hypothetical protein VG916_10400, partial [Gemmatimonadaceae bacterium]|nr:hypothetical protein [Gemmatimonadaceae bacterium]